ncbi:MAG TPA: hypothetical protein VMI34_00020 [Candidatus Bathyarchaeia archaeon]|nr:hypothetical protein [Candidatus Bathyarchaeia archaeon]
MITPAPGRIAGARTAWAGSPVAKLIQLFGMLDASKLLEAGKRVAFSRATSG